MPQSLNRFAYVYNNPLRYIDPTGNKGEHGIQSSWWGATLNAAADVADFFTVSGEEVENSTGVERFVNEVGYRTQNLVSFGAWSRQEQIAGAYFERGEISGASFVGGTLLNAAASGGQAAVAISTLGAGSLAAAVGSNAAIAVADKFAWETFENQAALRDGYSSLGDYAVTGAVAGALGGAGYGLGRLAASPLGRMSVREAGKAVPAFLREAKRELRTVASGLMSDAGAFGRGFGRGWRGFEAPARGARLLDVTSVPGVVAEEVATRSRQAASAVREGLDEIRLYRGRAMGGVDDVFIADPRLIVEMPFVGKGASNANSQGWLRDSDYYWKEMVKRHPEAFNDENLRILAGETEGVTAPKNNAAFRSVFRQYDVRGLRGQALIHHHIGGGGQAFAVPKGLHPGYGGIHNVEKELGIWGGEAAVADVLQRLLKGR